MRGGLASETCAAASPLHQFRSSSLIAPEAAAAIEREWRDLAEDAAEPQPFYSPSLLIPALKAFADETLRLAVVRDQAGQMIAFAPVAPVRGYSRAPIPYVATWMHAHCYLGVPLVRRGREGEALGALFDLVESGGAFFRLRHLSEKGPIFRAAVKTAAATGRLCATSARFYRAMLKGGYQTDAYLAATMRGKKRKEQRRLRARLEEVGAVAFERLPGGEELQRWTDEFLALEASGWKGREGTALASDGAARRFFQSAIRRAFEAGSLRFFRLSLSQKPIAMIVNFIDRGEAYSFKIAHDEAYARFSPGVMIEIEMMKALEREPALNFIDSCAAPDHPMINPLWRERRAIAALNVSGKSAAAKFLFWCLTTLEAAGEKIRERAGNRMGESSSADL